jgi:hypothetical protein
MRVLSGVHRGTVIFTYFQISGGYLSFPAFLVTMDLENDTSAILSEFFGLSLKRNVLFFKLWSQKFPNEK